MTLSTSSQPTRVAGVLEQKRRFLVPSVYHFYRNPPLIVRGEGCYLIDADGNKYLDCYSGVGAMSVGHSNPEILAAAYAQMKELQHTTTIYLTQPMFDLAEQLAELAPGDLRRTFFCASGTEANEAAMLMAAIHTGREGFLSLKGGLHGRTKTSMSVTRIPMWRTDPFLLDSCREVPGYRDRHSIDRIAQELFTKKHAAFIAEPIQGNGGIVIPSSGYWSKIRDLCTETGTLLIADEVQTGINRTGSFFAIEQENVVPDFITSAKALGNGFPIAVCITNDDIAASNTSPAASTYGGNPIACRAALATLDFHQQHRLGERSAEMGLWFLERLKELSSECDVIREVRGRGLMIGIELKESDDETAAQLTDRILELLKDRGFLLGKTGMERNVLTLMPPLIVSRDQLTELHHNLRELLQFETEKCEESHTVRLPMKL